MRGSCMYILLRRGRGGDWTTELAASPSARKSTPGEISDVVRQAYSAVAHVGRGVSRDLNLRVFTNTPGGEHSLNRSELLAIVESHRGCNNLIIAACDLHNIDLNPEDIGQLRL